MNKFFATLILSLLIALAASADTPTSTTIAGTGDIVMGLNFPTNNIRLPANDGNDLFSYVGDFLRDADFTVGNLEGVLQDKGEPAKRCTISACYIFRMPTSYARHLVDAGFDAMSIANNHARDFGMAGLESTMATLQQAGIAYAGVKDVCNTAIVERNGVKYGYVAFAPNVAMCSVLDYNFAAKIVRDLAKKVDIIVAGIHAGAEGAEYTHVTRQTETYIGENRGNIYTFAHMLIDNGVDVIFAHGPHVVRGMELYNGRFIAYSLGNFCTPYSVNIKGINGYAPAVKVTVDATNGEFLSGEILPAVQTDRSGPRKDVNNVVIPYIIKLSKSDFPESKLQISADGKLSIAE